MTGVEQVSASSQVTCSQITQFTMSNKVDCCNVAVTLQKNPGEGILVKCVRFHDVVPEVAGIKSQGSLKLTGVQLAATEADCAAHHCRQSQDRHQDGPPVSLQGMNRNIVSLDHCWLYFFTRLLLYLSEKCFEVSIEISASFIILQLLQQEHSQEIQQTSVGDSIQWGML